jgi:hypothetical protein
MTEKLSEQQEYVHKQLISDLLICEKNIPEKTVELIARALKHGNNFVPSDKRIPVGAIGAIDGLFYKIGRFDRVFYWNMYDWVRSDKTANTVLHEINNKKDKFALC